ncbi:MAG: SRPBCC family protein [Dehalococcoidia bacterium]
MTLVVYSSRIPASPEELFEFHMDANNLIAISPRIAPMRILSETKRAEVGDLQVMRVGPEPFASAWHARITRIVPGRMMEDGQERGPFRKWRHQHRVSPQGDGARLTDAVSFRMLPTPVGEFLEYWMIRPVLLGMFAYRHRKTRALLAHSKA